VIVLYIELYIECKLKLNMKTEKDQRRVITTMPLENAALEFFDISCNVYHPSQLRKMII